MPIAVFANMRAVIRAEQICRQNDIPVTVIPVPESVSSECGMCLMVTLEILPQFNESMQRAAIPVNIHDKI